MKCPKIFHFKVIRIKNRYQFSVNCCSSLSSIDFRAPGLFIAVEFYNKAKDLKLKGVLQNQYDRALLSIVLNLAERSAKPTAKDRKRYYYTSLGSFREIQSLLQLSGNLQLLTDSDSFRRSSLQIM